MLTECPYKGLVPYSEDDAPYFFGRDPERRLISASLRASRLTVLYGESGAGKSSVLAAGVAHDLREDPEFALILFRNWRDEPAAGLVDAVRASLSRMPGFPPNGNEHRPGELGTLFSAWSYATKRYLLIVLDQFDEYFQYNPGEKGAGTLAEELPRLLNRADLPVNFLIALRQDALSTLDRFKGAIPNLFDNLLRVEHLSKKAAQEAIVKPLERFNDDLRAGNLSGGEINLHPIEIEPALAVEVVEEILVAQGEGQQGVQAAYLQLVMTRWWEKERQAGSPSMRAKALRELGGVKTIVSHYLEDTLAAIGPGERKLVSEAFRYMVTPTGRRIAQTLTDLAKSVFPHLRLQDTSALAAVLEKLRNARVLTAVPPPRGSRPDERCYEFAHDVVAKAAFGWTKQFRQAQELTKLRRFALALGAMLALALADVAYVFWQRAEAHALELRMTSHRLAAVAVNQLDTAPDLSVLLAMHALDAEATPEAIDALNRALLALRPLEFTLAGHSDKVTAIAFSPPDGKLLASGSQDHTARIWDANTGQVLHVLSSDPSEAITAVSFSPDGKRLATAGRGKDLTHQTLRIWDVLTGRPLSAVPAKAWITAAVYHPKKPTIATAEVSLVNNMLTSTIRIWDATDANSGAREIKHWNVPSEVNALAFSISGAALAAGCDDRIVRVWQVSDPRKVYLTLKGHTDKVMAVAFDPDGQSLASAGMDRTVRISNSKAENLRTLLTGHTNTVFAIAYDSAGRMVSASADALVKVWDPVSGRELLNFAGHAGPVEGVAFSLDGKRVASASWDGTVRIWNAECHRGGITDVAFSPDGSQLATASRDDTVKLWDRKTGRELKTLRFHSDEVNRLAYSRDGQLLAAASNDMTASVWDTVSGKFQMFLRASSPVNAVAFNPSRTEEVVTGEEDGDVTLWEVKIGVPPHALGHRQYDHAINGVKFSPDGTVVASGGAGQTLKLWNTAPGAVVPTLTGHKLDTFAVAFSPDGSTLASASLDDTAKLWDVASGNELHTFGGHRNAVSDVKFSMDGKCLATTSWDRTVRIWDVKSGAEKWSFKTETSVNGVAFSRDGKRLAVASEDVVPHVYILDKGDLMQQARDRMRSLGRKLQPDECTKFLGVKTCPATP